MSFRVVLVDDHPLYRMGLKAAIAPSSDLEVVGEASDLRSALEIVEATRPDVVVLDVSLPGSDGIAVAKRILREKGASKILFLSMHKGVDYVRQSFAAGATGYVSKEEPPANVVEAIRSVARGAMYISPELSRISDPVEAKTRQGGTLEDLSAREREIFSLIVRGFSSQEIAKELCISIKTVETHRAHINSKLGVHSTGEIVRLAAMRGMIPL